MKFYKFKDLVNPWLIEEIKYGFTKAIYDQHVDYFIRYGKNTIINVYQAKIPDVIYPN